MTVTKVVPHFTLVKALMVLVKTLAVLCTESFVFLCAGFIFRQALHMWKTPENPGLHVTSREGMSLSQQF